MTIDNALAGVAVRDIQEAATWYEQLMGQPGKQPMSNLREWSLPRGGVLQVFEDPTRAGSSSVTLSVRAIDDHVAHLSGRGITIEDTRKSPQVSTASFNDPDGNRIVLAEQHSDDVAR